MKQLEEELILAEKKKEERELKREIIKTALPFRFEIKFSKFMVVFCVAAIMAYTIAAIILQQNTATEISPTLTTCVYAFFGSELLGMAGIKIFDTKYGVQDSNSIETESDDIEYIELENDDNGAVG